MPHRRANTRFQVSSGLRTSHAPQPVTAAPTPFVLSTSDSVASVPPPSRMIRYGVARPASCWTGGTAWKLW